MPIFGNIANDVSPDDIQVVSSDDIVIEHSVGDDIAKTKETLVHSKVHKD